MGIVGRRTPKCRNAENRKEAETTKRSTAGPGFGPAGTPPSRAGPGADLFISAIRRNPPQMDRQHSAATGRSPEHAASGGAGRHPVASHPLERSRNIPKRLERALRSRQPDRPGTLRWGDRTPPVVWNETLENPGTPGPSKVSGIVVRVALCFQRALFAFLGAPAGGKRRYTVVNTGTTSAVSFRLSAGSRMDAWFGGNPKLPEAHAPPAIGHRRSADTG